MILLAIAVSAAIACTNANYLHSAHCTAPVESFTVLPSGEAYGKLTSGVEFTQKNIANNLTRLQRFEMQEAFWYVSDKGDIQAGSDFEALSIYLSR